MSFLLMAKVIKEKIPDCYAKWLMVVLADYANEETHKCWPSLTTIEERTSMNRSTITRKLNWLEEEGYVTRQRGNNKRSTVYTLYPQLVADSTQLGADSTPNLLLTSKTKIEDWHPSDELIVSINSKGEIDHDLEADQFRNHHLAKGTKLKDIDRGYRYWCNNVIKWRAEKESGSKATGNWKAKRGGHKSSLFGGIHSRLSGSR